MGSNLLLTRIHDEWINIVKSPWRSVLVITGVSLTTVSLSVIANRIIRKRKLSKRSIMEDIGDGVKISPFCTPEEPLIEYAFDDCKTELEAFYRGYRLHKNGEGNCLGFRTTENSEYSWLSYKDVEMRVKLFASGMVKLVGISPGQESMVCLYSANRPEWDISVLACHMYSMVPVPLYDTLGNQALEYIIKQTEPAVIVLDNADKLVKLLSLDHSVVALIKKVVVMDEPDPDIVKQLTDGGINIYTFNEVATNGSLDPQDTMPATPDDISSLLYTSGTTGDPKGVMITHRNSVTTASSLCIYMQRNNIALIPGDKFFSYLPAAHGMERNFHTFGFMNGMAIGYFRGDIKAFGNDAKMLQPHFMPMVPRLLNRFYDVIMAKVENSLMKKSLFNIFIKPGTPKFLQAIMFKEARLGLGGQLKVVSCGAAPIDPQILQFARSVLGCLIIEGYGQSEAVAACTANAPDDPIAGHVGFILPCLTLKLVDVPDMNYFADEGKGEICFRGHGVMKGYYKQPEKTAEAIDADGWLHSGDIGAYTDHGMLKIIDRKKAIFKLAQGEYVAPEKIENIYSKIAYIAQMFVYGESLKSYLIGLVFIDEEVFMKHFQEKEKRDVDDLCKDKEVIAKVLKDLLAMGNKNKLNSFEQVRAIGFSKDLMTVEDGLLTPTLKAKRPQITQKFKSQLENIYNQ